MYKLLFISICFIQCYNFKNEDFLGSVFSGVIAGFFSVPRTYIVHI